METIIPISKYVPAPETYELVNDVLSSGQLSQGKYVEMAEEEIARISNCEYAVCVANGTIALEAMLRASPYKSSTITTSPLTFRATIKAIENSGLTANFADIDNVTLCLEGGSRMNWMTVDLYGRKSSIDGKYVYSDSAQGIGLDLSDRFAASLSFYTTKNVGAGEGGAIVTNDKNIADKIRMLRNQGMANTYDYQSNEGYNWRWNELAAAVALPQLWDIENINGRRASNAVAYYNPAFLELEEYGLVRPISDGTVEGEMVWHQYTLRHSKRDVIVQNLRARNIDARVYYPELISPKDQWEQTPNALQASKEVFQIPVHNHLTDRQIEYIIENVIEVVKAVGVWNQFVF